MQNNNNRNNKIVAVTGASGFIGSHLCQNLLAHGYTVRACVREFTPHKTQHLLDMRNNNNSNDNNNNNNHGSGSLEIHVADMFQPGAYDDIFQGCYAVCHVAGNFGTDPRWQQQPQQQLSYEQGVYESYVRSMQYILDSIARSNTVKRLIYTSSQCTGPYISKHHPVYESFQDNPYAKGKEDCEVMIYNFALENRHRNIICASSVPCEVLGPILASPTHDVVYPHRLADILAGKWTLPIDNDDDDDSSYWCIADVRDIAETQRRMLEYPHLSTGMRFYNGADASIACRTLIRQLQREFLNDYQGPRLVVDDNHGEQEEQGDSSHDDEDSHASSYGESEWEQQGTTMWSNPETVLGVTRTAATQTIRETVQSLVDLNVINRPLSVSELQNYYKVAEMDGEEAEMEYIRAELERRRKDAEH